MSRGILLIASFCLAMPLAFAAERSLPRGEEHPKVITKVFSSPLGEVQFVEVNGGASAFLRDAKGDLGGLHEVQGPKSCDAWLVSQKEEVIPTGCSFVFHNDFNGRYERVNSEEMQEASLFQLVRGTLRGKDVAL